jgi:hypothetical protein
MPGGETVAKAAVLVERTLKFSLKTVCSMAARAFCALQTGRISMAKSAWPET